MNMVFRANVAVNAESAPRAGLPFDISAAAGVSSLSAIMEQGCGQQALGRLLGVLVQEQDAPLVEQIGTLREAQDVVRGEMERLARVQPLDQEALRELGGSAHEFAEQAEALILHMVRDGTPEVLVALVEEVFDSFRDAERLIEIAIKRRRR